MRTGLEAAKGGGLARAQAGGLTLLELLVALAVLGLLAGLAWPSWSAHVRELRRLDAQQALQALHLAQTRWRSQQGQFATALQQLGARETSPDAHYRLSIEAVDAQGYTLLATAQGPQAHDSACNPMRLQLRERATLVLDGGPDRQPRCWR